MGLQGEPAIVGIAEWPPERRYGGERRLTLVEQWADLAAKATG